MSAQYKSALLRGLILGVLTGASTRLATWATSGDLKTILIAAGQALPTSPVPVPAGAQTR